MDSSHSPKCQESNTAGVIVGFVVVAFVDQRGRIFLKDGPVSLESAGFSE